MREAEELYLQKIRDVLNRGVREESFYPILLELLEKKGVKAVQLPSKTTAGFPDIKIFQPEGFIIGYIECKKPQENIEKWVNSEQVKRYRKHFKNFILTNFVSFKHFLNGEEVKSVQLIPYEKLKKGNLESADFEGLRKLLKDFLNYCERPIRSVEELAESLAWRVRLLKEELLKELKVNSGLREFLNLLKEFVIHTINEEEFADTIAQSLAYALLIVRTKREFVRKEDIITEIPENLAIIRDIFLEVLKIEGKELNWIIDEIENVLNLFDIRSVKLTPEELTIHFYETFLKAYNPKLREIRGVYYTPKPVVSFIVRSIEELLIDKLNVNGYFDEKLKLLDPAAGTLTFILEVFGRLKKNIEEKIGSGSVPGYFKDVVLNNFFAFELLPAPYVIGHLKASRFLEEIGLKEERLKFYLTNALEFEHKMAGYLFSPQWAKELQEADRIKREERMLVVLGNPPYSGISANNTEEINSFLKRDVEGCQSYYKVDGKKLNEKNPKWLQDDYVKFIRFAQWKVNQSGRGVVGFITNHSYIDNPTFRGMRQSLLKTFDEIYILDLHGNKRKKEPDENVFDIQQGVAIGIFVKNGSKKGDYADVYYLSTLKDGGLLTRNEKFDFLNKNSVKTINWRKVSPKSSYYFFKPVLEDEEYQNFPRVDEIFDIYSVGIVSGKDKLFIDFDRNDLVNKIAAKLPLNFRRIRASIKEILYRPFDVRYIFYSPNHLERAREKIMKHMFLGKNLGLITHKREEIVGEWKHAFVTTCITEHGSLSSKTTNYLFPLYLYTGKGKVPNFTEKFKSYIRELYKEEPTPEEIFYYIYGVLYSPKYREKYGELLKYEFPRIPFPKEYKKFKQVADLGKELVELHLLKSPSLSLGSLTSRFEGEGDGRIERVFYRNGKVYINKNQFFFPVKEEIWNYKIGGYQVLKKWLSDRKGRALTHKDIGTYLKIVKAIEETLKIQERLRRQV